MTKREGIGAREAKRALLRKGGKGGQHGAGPLTVSKGSAQQGEREVAMAARLAEILRDRIVRGALAPDERIVERRLCAELSVSRTPLREALKLLEIDGLVEIHRNRGARVAPLGAEDARHLFEVLAGIEATAAALAAERIGAEAMMTLEAMHARMLAHFRAGERDAYFVLNSDIHQAVLAAAANPHLSETHARLMLRAMRGRYAAIMEPQRLSEAVGEHDALMAALRARNAPAAERIWRRHLLRTGEAVAGVIERAEETSLTAAPG